MKYIKWALVLTLVFVSAVLAGPLYAVACWVDRPTSELWLDVIGEGLKTKLIQDFKL